MFRLAELLRLGDHPASKNKRPLDRVVDWWSSLFWKKEKHVEENGKENKTGAEIPAGLLEEESCLRVFMWKGTTAIRALLEDLRTHVYALTHTPTHVCTFIHTPFIWYPLVKWVLLLPALPAPPFTRCSGNARGAGQTCHTKYEVGALASRACSGKFSNETVNPSEQSYCILQLSLFRNIVILRLERQIWLFLWCFSLRGFDR